MNVVIGVARSVQQWAHVNVSFKHPGLGGMFHERMLTVTHCVLFHKVRESRRRG